MYMLWYILLVTWCSLNQVQATEKESPRIIIVGAGVSGIAAASRLLQNGFNNITILEAENRIGGRVYTREFGGYLVDVGGQWVFGEKDNVAYELAWPLGLIAHSLSPPPSSKFFGSSDGAISDEMATNLLELYSNISENAILEEYANKSTGDYYKRKFDEYFESHPEIKPEQRTPITNMFDLLDMAMNAADTWYNISIPSYTENVTAEDVGDLYMDWKEKGYSSILDILMVNTYNEKKKIPNSSEELPVLNNTVLNTQVSHINYNGSGTGVQIITANGDEFTADHVIVTTSIEVLKADHKTMFNPQLPEVKIKAMKGLHLGNVVKLFLVYDEPWWVEKNETFNSYLHLYWTEEDRNEIANDPEKSWLLGLSYVTGIAHKPRLLLCWITGPYARQMETHPEDRVFTGIKEILQRFFGRAYNLTEPTAMLRSQWYSNRHFRGTWSYHSPEFRNSGAKLTDLSDPLMKDGKPVVLIAGEITSDNHYGTVHGAIDSGWREADRLKKFYAEPQKN